MSDTNDYRFEMIVLAGLILIATIGFLGWCSDARADEVLRVQVPQPTNDHPNSATDSLTFTVEGQQMAILSQPAVGEVEVTIPDQEPVRWEWDVAAHNGLGSTPSSNGPQQRRGMCSYDYNQNTIVDAPDLGKILSSGRWSEIGAFLGAWGTLCP